MIYDNLEKFADYMPLPNRCPVEGPPVSGKKKKHKKKVISLLKSISERLDRMERRIEGLSFNDSKR